MRKLKKSEAINFAVQMAKSRYISDAAHVYKHWDDLYISQDGILFTRDESGDDGYLALGLDAMKHDGRRYFYIRRDKVIICDVTVSAQIVRAILGDDDIEILYSAKKTLEWTSAVYRLCIEQLSADKHDASLVGRKVSLEYPFCDVDFLTHVADVTLCRLERERNNF